MDILVTAHGLEQEEFTAQLPSNLEGKTYNATKVEKVVNQLSDLAGQKGFAFVQVRPQANKNTEDRIIDITYELVEGSRIFVERIDIEGNTQTLDRVIRREVELVEGDAFDTTQRNSWFALLRQCRGRNRTRQRRRPGSGENQGAGTVDRQSVAGDRFLVQRRTHR
jgi:outer membrane protein insertion porin family